MSNRINTLRTAANKLSSHLCTEGKTKITKPGAIIPGALAVTSALITLETKDNNANLVVEKDGAEIQRAIFNYNETPNGYELGSAMSAYCYDDKDSKEFSQNNYLIEPEQETIYEYYINYQNAPKNETTKTCIDKINSAVAQVIGYKSNKTDYDPQEIHTYGEKSLKRDLPALLKILDVIAPNAEFTLNIKDKLKNDNKTSLFAFEANNEGKEIVKGFMSTDGDSISYHIDTNEMTIIGEQSNNKNMSRTYMKPITTTKIQNESKKQENKEEKINEVSDSQNNIELVKFVFPRKGHRFTTKQMALKEVTADLWLPKTECEKLTEVCKKLFEKDVTTTDGKTLVSDDVTGELTKEISSKDSKIEDTINKYYELLIQKENTSNHKDDYFYTDFSSMKEADTSLKEFKANRPEPLKVIEKIDLPEEKRKRPRIPRDSGTKVTVNETNGVYSTESPVSAEAPVQAASSNITTVDSKLYAYKYQVPGTVKADFGEAFEEMFNKFKKSLQYDLGYEPKLAKTYRIALTVTKNDVTKELKRRTGLSSYEHINEDMAGVVAEVINSDRRFAQYFDLHAAMRFIDRFVDFDSNVDMVVQGQEMLDCLLSVIKKAFKQGVDISSYEAYKDKYGKIHYSARLNIEPSIYDEREGMFFGTYPLGIGVGRDAENIKKPMIRTLFPVVEK